MGPINFFSLTFFLFAIDLILPTGSVDVIKTRERIQDLIADSQKLPAGMRRIFYHHDQTGGIVDQTASGEIQSCYLFEPEILNGSPLTKKNVTNIEPLVELTFQAMMDVIHRCESLDKPDNSRAELRTPRMNPLQIIIPGTKWCGTGDLAEDYYDLGNASGVDRCCRSHDLCPVRMSSLEKKYGLLNWSLTTRSHCNCDKAFYDCLKNDGSSFGNTIGKLYFSYGQYQCLNDTDGRGARKSTGAARQFVPTKLKW